MSVLSPTSLQITWLPPLQINGALDSVTVKLNDQRINADNVTHQRSMTVDALHADTSYDVTLTVCTGV